MRINTIWWTCDYTVTLNQHYRYNNLYSLFCSKLWLNLTTITG